MNFTVILTAIGLGIAYAAAPGAVNTEAIRRGATHGSRSTFLVETGSLLGDSLWALLALTGVTFFAQFLPAQILLGIVGGFFLLRLAWVALWEAFSRSTSSATTSPVARGDFATGIVFGLANPVGLAFWSGVGSSVVASGVTGIQFLFFFAGFFAGAVIWCVLISIAMHWGRRWIRPVMFRWINVLCGLALGFFGVRVLWTTAQELLEHYVLSSLKSTR
ncbi:MAG TPA: LysE family transporter [Ktedonobacteraceae bacterium]|nr:LysE family transporter [Ktedonobacteraceae bacterium]